MPFEPSTLAEAAGIAALEDQEFLQQSLELNATGLRFVSESLAAMGLKVVPSDANFVMVVLSSNEEAEAITGDAPAGEPLALGPGR